MAKGNILRINSPDTGQKDAEGGLAWGSADHRKAPPGPNFGEKLSRATPKAVVKVSMLRDAREPPYPTYKRRRKAPLNTQQEEEKRTAPLQGEALPL
jgi:hypothetical protein